MLNDGREATYTTTDGILSAAASDDKPIDCENCSYQLANETSSDNQSMDDDFDNDQTVDRSSSDDKSVDDATTDNHVKNEAMSSDGNSGELRYFRNSL